MLFNSYDFALYFLPVALAAFYFLAHSRAPRLAASWLGIASLFFYGYWAPRFLLLLLGSIAANYGFGIVLRRLPRTGPSNLGRLRKWVLVAAIVGNLGLLIYFKYANFFLQNINTALGTSFPALGVILPIGISFFTFTQIAYVVDTYEGKVKETDPWHYLLFVTFFPHLIAGPILHHAEMMPQFAERKTYRFQFDWFVTGLLIFAIGLAKKVILADGIQPYVAPVFDYSAIRPLSAYEAWGGALAYTLQLYFDFSGYSDMAIGLSRMFNIHLPLNFASPYKATNISDFWRRWHMTLSRFLRDYLYVPLGGNRRGKVRRYANLFATMVLGGLWHGAAWTFVIWGALHGLYLCCYHAWTALRTRLGLPARETVLGRLVAQLATFLCVVVGWVFFRAESFLAAMRVLTGMAGLNQNALSGNGTSSLGAGSTLQALNLQPIGDERQLVWILVLLAIAWLLPNTQTLVPVPSGKQGSAAQQMAFLLTGMLAPVLLLLLMINASRGISEFIYFNF